LQIIVLYLNIMKPFARRLENFKWIEKIGENELDIIEKELQNDACIIDSYTND